MKPFPKNCVFSLKIQMITIHTFPDDQTTETQKGACTSRSSWLSQRNQAHSKNPTKKLNFIQIVETNIKIIHSKKISLVTTHSIVWCIIRTFIFRKIIKSWTKRIQGNFSVFITSQGKEKGIGEVHQLINFERISQTSPILLLSLIFA